MPVAAPTSAAPPRGILVMLGGGDDDPMLALLADMLPDRTAPLEVLTTATRRQPARTAAAYAQAWRQLDCPNVGHLRADESFLADDPETLERLRKAKLVFMLSLIHNLRAHET
jgi:cyanophycinase